MKILRKGKILLAASAAAMAVSLVAQFGERQPAGARAAFGPAGVQALRAPDTAGYSFGDEAAPSLPSAAPAGPDSLQQEAAGEVTVRRDPDTDTATLVRASRGGDLYPQGRSLEPLAKATAFMARHGSVFGVKDVAADLRVIGIREDQYGNRRVSWQQVHGDVPVFGGIVHGHVSSDGRLTAVNGKFLPDVNLPSRATVPGATAADLAVAAVAQRLPATLKNADLEVGSSGLLVYRKHLTRGTPGNIHLAYEVEVTHGNAVREFVYVDALSGKVVDTISGIHGLKDRRVYEGQYDPDSPDFPPPAWQEGDLRPAADPAHEDEVSGAGQTYNLFLNLSGGTYRSWDGNDAQMITVNNDPTILCPNANWNGTSTNYCTGTSADDVVAHEWTHAYTQETSGLIYQWQSGALNESYSDIFGETVDLINNREGVEGTAATGNDGPRSQDESVCSEFVSETPTGDQSIRWLVGEDAFAFTGLPSIGDGAIRDMWNPRCASGATGVFTTDPGHMTSGNYSCSSGDAGGVHTNSAINNRAYAFLVDGNTLELRDDGTPFDNPVTVSAIGLTKAAHIFWRANSVYNTPSTTMPENADSLEMACEDLVGVNLNKLVTTAEDGTGLLGINDDTVDPVPEPSGEIITAGDCAQVANAIAAVEMRHDVTKQCGFKNLLDPAPAPRCGNAEVETFFRESWEGGFPAGWSTGQQPVSKSVLDTREWFVRSGDLPANPDGSARAGNAIFQENRRDLGNCTTDDESGSLHLDSPPITVGSDEPGHLLFEHYVNTETGYDGGNLLISINGGEFVLVPGDAFEHNAYPSNLNGVVDQNTNPKAGEPAWHGSNDNSVFGDWGESQVDLAAAGVAPGDTVVLRWDFGQDGCNGNEGWYVDSVELFTCGDPIDPPTETCNAYPASGFLPVVGSPIVSLVGSQTSATVSGEMEPVSDVSVRNMTGSHTYMGDLTFELQSPAGTAVTLFDGANCASEDGINVEFDDDATSVIGCGDWLSGGSFRPHEALAAFADEDANGDWTLTITDAFPQDEGQLDSWELEFCTPITPTNTAPVAANDSAETRRNRSVTISVLTNDSDADGDCLSVESVTDPANGTAVINSSGSCDAADPDTITYTPDPGYLGTDTFNYTVHDGNGGRATAQVAVEVKRKDDDDHDDDGDSDDEDSDDDNDGKKDDEDSDDDNDGIDDDADSDDDNDGIPDRHDSKSTNDDFRSQSARTDPGTVDRFYITADEATVALSVTARGTTAGLLSMSVYDPNGLLVATSVPLGDGALAVVPAAIAGTYSIDVHNAGGQAADYDLAATTRQFRP